MIKLIFRHTAIFAIFVFAVAIFAQTDGTYAFTDANVQITFPQSWTIDEKSNGDVHFYEIDFDRTSGQQPRGAIFRVSVVEKAGETTLEDAFPVVVRPSDLEPYAVEDASVPMLRADLTLAGNVPAARLLIDADEDSWLYIQITNSDKEIVDTILASMTAIGGGDMGESDSSSMIQIPDTLGTSFDIPDAGIAISVPEDWLIVDTSDLGQGAVADFYASPFDRDSGQQPRDVIIKSYMYDKFEDETIEMIFSTLVINDEEMEIYEVNGAMLTMLRGDETIVGNVTVAHLIIDADEDTWVNLEITNADKPIVDEILAYIVPISGADMTDVMCELPSDDALISVVLMSDNGNSLSTIKAVRTITGLGLADAKDIVDSAPDAIITETVDATIAQGAVDELVLGGASVEMRVNGMVYDPAGCVETMGGAGLYDVVITEVGMAKIDVIKAVRSLTGLGLAEAKNLVESVNGIVLAGVDLETAEAAKIELEAAGATITLTELP